MNSRLDTLQAAVLIPKFKAFCEYELDAVNKVAELYSRELEGSVVTPEVPDDFYSSWAQYTIQLEDKEIRDRLQSKLKEKDIPTMIYYPKPMHAQTAFKDVKQYVECPVTERLCDTVLALPMHPYMSEDQVTFVTDNIKDLLKN